MVQRNILDYKHININPPGEFRMLLVSLLSALIGILAGL